MCTAAELQDIKSGNEQEAANLEQGTKAAEESNLSNHLERVRGLWWWT